MRTRTKIAIVGLAAGGIGVVGASIAAATAGDDDGSDTPITGSALAQASSVAVEHLGEGRVTGTEVGDEESYYEVEVTLDDGRQVDVQLDEEFNVVSDQTDSANDD